MNLQTKEEFEKIAKANGLKGKWLERYAKFMNRRFGQKGYWTVESYAEEWVGRFEKGVREEKYGVPEGINPAPMCYMDGESLEIYNKILSEEKRK